MIQWRSFWAEKGRKWGSKHCRHLGLESSRQKESEGLEENMLGKSRNLHWGQWWKEVSEEDRADLRRWQMARTRPSGFYSIQEAKPLEGSMQGTDMNRFTFGNDHSECCYLKYCWRRGCKQRDQSESPCQKPGERWWGPGWWEWNDEKWSDSAICCR